MATKKNTKTEAAEVVSESKDTTAKTAKKPKKVTLNEYVDVQSCVQGKLIWKSQKTGYKVVWNEYGEINPMQVSDLIDMRNGAKAFFIKNCVAIVGDRAKEVMDYLQVSKYYSDIMTPDDMDELLLGNAKDVKTYLESASTTIRGAAVSRAKELYNEGILDSAKTVAVIKNVTGFDISA